VRDLFAIALLVEAASGLILVVLAALEGDDD
jgi:hypothetical protein